MAEKPKLKATDEILSSIGKKRGKQPPVLQGDNIPPPIQRMDDPGEKKPHKGAKVPEPQGEENAEPLVDQNPLDFDKYQLPKRKKKAAKPAPKPAETPAQVETVAAKQPVVPAPPKPTTAILPPQEAKKKVTEYQFPDLEAAKGADAFVAQFQQEEELRETDFKEILAEKFMRERERYLLELGIADQMEAEERAKKAAPVEPPPSPAPVDPARRKLDYQIQPEMHMQQGDRPVTYNRNATVQPQIPQPVDLPETAAPPLPQEPEQPEGGKKTSAQLLLELAAQNNERAQRKVEAPPKPTQFHFRFTPAESSDKKKRSKAKKTFLFTQTTVMGRIVTLSAAAGVLVLALVAWTITSALHPGGLIEDTPNLPTAGETQSQLNAYENYIATAQTTFADAVVWRSGLTLSNLTVTNRLVVEEEAAALGALTLSNVQVGETIFIKSGGTNLLELTDVKAKKLIIDNSKSSVTIRTSGDTDIGAVELRTPAVLEGEGLNSDASGVGAVLVKNNGDTAALSFDLSNTSLETLATQGETALTFAGGQVETMTSDGSFNLTGSGRVQNLSAGYTVGAGAGDFLPPAPVNILIQGVEVGHLNVKSPANLNLATQVDSAAAASSINLGGNGSLGSLVFNSGVDTGRLAVDISGLNVQQLTTNTEALIHCSGSSAINTLIANQSTYALGNKVNHLKVNASGVIFEREPDLKTIAPGIPQPQSKADNPNLNYSLGLVGVSTQPTADTTADSVATTCDHARELGGFLIGTGSKDNPFVVTTPAQLAHVDQHPSSHFFQTQDINLGNDSSYSGGFPMIGAAGTRFSGVYDGGGYGVANLRIIAEGDGVGLFSENTGTIRNLSIISGEITAGVDAFMGSIAGFNLGTVESCSNGAWLHGPTASYSGGIVGYNYGGTVRDCYNTAKIQGGGITGGVVGMNRNGTSSARVAGSYNVGLVEGDTTVGAVVGVNEDAVVTNSYYLDSAAEAGIGSGSGTAAGKSTAEMSASQMAADLSAANDSSLWQTSSDPSYAYPTLKKPAVAVPSSVLNEG